MKYKNEKIIFNRKMRDFLIENGGILLKTKSDLKDRKRDIYIFRADSVEGKMKYYKRGVQNERTGV